MIDDRIPDLKLDMEKLDEDGKKLQVQKQPTKAICNCTESKCRKSGPSATLVTRTAISKSNPSSLSSPSSP
ncbi:hypothetical protein MRB53_019015 [Persea americana]|uniref:Uncharacterized protein n=1 Tax=Persea americana TaxID=3435 RepID=A0ACC2MAE1_PERAE|nr:hypothetical protein MRB53_019015 [Persea americana]